MTKAIAKRDELFILPTGINPDYLPDDLSQHEWTKIGQSIARFEGGTQWAKGDWWAFGEWKDFGERREIAERTFPDTPVQSLKDLAVVARSYSPDERIRTDTLSFSTRRSLAAHPDLLPQALEEKWTQAQAEAAVRELKAPAAPLRRAVSRHPEPDYDEDDVVDGELVDDDWELDLDPDAPTRTVSVPLQPNPDIAMRRWAHWLEMGLEIGEAVVAARPYMDEEQIEQLRAGAADVREFMEMLT